MKGILSATHNWLEWESNTCGDAQKLFIACWNWNTRGARLFLEKRMPLYITWYYHYRDGYRVLWKVKAVHKILSLFSCSKIEYCWKNNTKCLSWVVATRNWENGENKIPTTVLDNLIMIIALRDVKARLFEYEGWNIFKII